MENPQESDFSYDDVIGIEKIKSQKQYQFLWPNYVIWSSRLRIMLFGIESNH
jgi:hypothetical protein